jgi:hypothetical protein
MRQNTNALQYGTTAEARYLDTVKECNYSDCIHFDTGTRLCPLEICAYDIKDIGVWSDVWEDECEWVE